MEVKERLKLLQKHGGFSTPVVLEKVLNGGDINEVYVICADYKRWVVKENNAKLFPEMLAKEFRSLQYLNKVSPLSYPNPFFHFEDATRQFLVMEYFEKGSTSEKMMTKLGVQLAHQHRISNPDFGWNEANYIGRLLQKNTPNKDGNYFFAEQRLMTQAQLAFDNYLLEKKDIQRLERVGYLIKEIFTDEPPALLHGDFWSGNFMISTYQEPVAFDPAPYFGNREADIAMTMLFGGFSAPFYTAYQSAFPLVEGWENRIPFFQLYPNLVHLNMFGKTYLQAIRKVINPF